MLDVGRLRLLLAISEHGGSAAPSRELSEWERELGFALVDGDRLTPAGRRLADHAGPLLAQLEAASADAAAVAGTAAGTLRLGVGAAAGRALLADALPALRSAAPALTLEVAELADEQVGALGAALDVVVVGTYATAVPRPADPALERRELLTEPLLLAVPSRHRVAGASIRLAELANEAWVGGSGDALVALERAAAGAGYAPRLVARVSEDALALTLVAAGLGVALVPASAVPQPVDGVRFVTVLDGGLRRTVVAAARRSGAADPAVRLVLDALGAAARRVAAAVPGVTAAATAAPPAPTRRPDPLLDPLPPAGSPWPNGSNGTPSYGSAAGSELPGPSFGPNGAAPSQRAGDLPGNGAELPGRRAHRSESGPADRPANGLPAPDAPGRYGTDRPDSARSGPEPQAGLPAPGLPPAGGLPAPGLPPAGEPRFGDAGGPGVPAPGDGGFGRRPANGLPAPGVPPVGDPRFRGPDSDPSGLPPVGDPRFRGPDSDPSGLPPVRDPRFRGRDTDPSGLPARADTPPGGLPATGYRRRDVDPAAGGLPAPGLPPAGSRRGGRDADGPAAGDRPRGGATRYDPDRPAAGYRTPAGDGPDAGTGGRPAGRAVPGPNPYRADPSGHAVPDPFRAGGPEVGPNPYRAGDQGRRGDGFGAAELFGQGDRRRTGALPPPGLPAPRSGSDGDQLPPVSGLTGSDLGARPPASPGAPRRSAARGGDGAEGTLPPAPAGSADDVRLSIFEDLQSEWFIQRDSTDGGPPKNPSWQMAADDGWRAAAKLAEPTTAGTTTAGLPRRRPQAMVVPGAVGGPATPGDEPRPSTPHRSPQEVRGRLSSYADGVRRGRHAQPSPTEEG